MEIFLEIRDSMSIFGCLSIELTESKLHCNGNIHIEENPEESVLEANGEWEFNMSVSDFGDIVHIIQKIEVTTIPEFAIGLDGTTYELNISNGFNSAVYHWWGEPPAGWESLGKFIPGCNTTGYPHRQAFPSVFINDHEYPKGFPIGRPCHDEIIAPDVILILWAESDTGTVIEPQPPSFRLLLWYLQPF